MIRVRRRAGRVAAALGAAAALAAGTTAAASTGSMAGSSPDNHRVTTVFVSPWGNDRDSGTNPGRAVHSLQRAQQVVRSLDSAMRGDIRVELADGAYQLSQPLALDARDSGTNGHTVIWTAAPGAHPVISGGTRVGGFRPSGRTTSGGAQIWSAAAPAGLPSREMYIDGHRAQRASGVVPVTLTATPTGYTASSDLMASWGNPTDIEFVYSGGDGYWSLHTGGLGAWTEPRCPIASISGATITMAEPCWINSTQRVMRTDGSGRTVNLVGPASVGNHELPTSVENARELLQQPGQFYYDGRAGRVEYVPLPGERLNHADVELATAQTLVSGTGTADAPVHDIAFSGLQFSYGTWDQPSSAEGFSEIQAGYTITGADGYATQGLCQFIAGGTCPFGNWTKEPGNVSFSHDQRISFTGDVFTHLGAAGLDLGDGSQNTVVRGSVFTDISGDGLELGGVDDPQPAVAGDHTVENQITDNHIFSTSVEYRSGVGIDVGYAENTLISHNQLDHTPYTAISLGWGGWPDKIKAPAIANSSHGNVVSDNLIYDAMQYLADGGAIYTQGITGASLADGEQITGNVIHDILDHGHAIYCDNGSTFMTITSNVEYNNQNDWGTRHADYVPPATGSTDDPLDVEHNYWQQGDRDSTARNVTVASNTIITGPQDAPSSIVDAAGLEPRYRGLLSVDPGHGHGAVPYAPQQAAAFAGEGAAYVSFTPTFFDQGRPVASYTVTASPGGRQVTVDAAAYLKTFYVLVPGLTDGIAYTFTVTANTSDARRAAWSGVHSAPSLPTGAVTPGPTTVLPAAPASASADVGVGDVSVHWNPETVAGGTTPTLSYDVTLTDQKTGTVTTVTETGKTEVWATKGRDTFAVVGGLAHGDAYAVTVAARNAAGLGPVASAGVVTVG
ncbi:right-handed parallel beta-helix repeat-containing protein [Catenulispora rubra]|uniref:right-handed parallel beta-helix repeat-containing protein n=1 Tax=Catenulispora rubra TaxID=280293 RepID=UPI001E57FC7F|nr:right-handed parallel beta-helix repeat-containing protein [Catenulispora rubra]